MAEVSEDMDSAEVSEDMDSAEDSVLVWVVDMAVVHELMPLSSADTVSV
jgi:hypothetical protein